MAVVKTVSDEQFKHDTRLLGGYDTKETGKERIIET